MCAHESLASCKLIINWRVEKDSAKDIFCIPYMRRRQAEKQNNLKVFEEQKRRT